MDRHEVLSSISKYANEALIRTFTPGKTYIPPAAPDLRPEDITTVGEALLNLWYTEHKFCRKFERELEKATGKKNVILVNSGSSASLIALTAARIRSKTKKRYVITCATGFPTTVSPIYQNGYIPIYVDINVDGFAPMMYQIKEAMTGPNKDDIAGMVFAHTLGFPYDEAEVRALLKPDQFLISDCCDAFGAKTHNSPVGTWADLSTLSFFPSHHIMSGEGGAVMTDDDELAVLASSLSNWGRSCYCRPGETNTCGQRFCWPERGGLPEGWDHKYIFDHLGYNLKMTEFQGALGFSQILRGNEIVAAHIRNYTWLYDQINRPEYMKHISLFGPMDGFSPFGFPIMADPATAVDMISYLEDHKIGTRRLFGGNLLRQPAFMYQPHIPPSNMIGSDALTNGLFWISVSPSLTQDMMDYMVYTIDQYFIERGLV